MPYQHIIGSNWTLMAYEILMSNAFLKSPKKKKKKKGPNFSFFMLGDHNLTPYDHSKNRPVWCDIESHKKFEFVFLITNWFWDGMA